MSHASDAPLEVLAQALSGAPDADWRSLARSLDLPAARLRAAAAFHPDLAQPPGDRRVCVGTSCFLRGASPPRADAVAAHCLGHCDASPCELDAAGEVRTAGARAAAASELRCSAAEPVVTRRLGRGAAGLDAARALGAYDALEAALTRPRGQVLDALERSGECGRGGAAFPTGAKWRAAAGREAAHRVVIANGDEGDPGSFVDRLLMEEDPHGVLEGLALCAWAVGADEAVVFVRSEYPAARSALETAIAEAEAHGWLGEGVRGSALRLRVRVARGFGSYVCGEETALLETLEGRTGEVRPRPPYPTRHGLHGWPTVVNNVETLVAVPWIVARGPDAYRALGAGTASGTKALCLSRGFTAPGVVEVELGRSLRTVIESDAQTPAEELAAVLLGGPMGSLLFPDDWDAPLDYGAPHAPRLGHGGLVAIPRDVDWQAFLQHLARFVARESCGKCVPCREGSQRIRAGVLQGGEALAALDRSFDVMEAASLCAFGRDAPGPLRTLLTRVPELRALRT